MEESIMLHLLNIPVLFGTIGAWEVILILLVILLLFGAKKLPELARGLGKGIKEFKGAVEGVEKELKDAVDPNDKPKEKDKPTEK